MSKQISSKEVLGMWGEGGSDHSTLVRGDGHIILIGPIGHSIDGVLESRHGLGSGNAGIDLEIIGKQLVVDARLSQT